MQRFYFSYVYTLLFSTIFAALGIAQSTRAASLTFSFRQDGFEEGATVEGFVVGEDLDQNGVLLFDRFVPLDNPTFIIPSANNEVTDFGATFSGSSRTEPITYGFEDLQYFSYDLDGGNLGDLDGRSFSNLNASNVSEIYTNYTGPGTFEGIDTGTYAVGFRLVGPCVEFSVCGYVKGSFSNKAVAVPEPKPFIGSFIALGFGYLYKRAIKKKANS